jgi:hypothetical protein
MRYKDYRTTEVRNMDRIGLGIMVVLITIFAIAAFTGGIETGMWLKALNQ